MNDVLEMLESKQRVERENSIAEYRQVLSQLANDAKPDHSEINRLSAIVGALGISPKGVKLDLEAVRRIKQLAPVTGEYDARFAAHREATAAKNADAIRLEKHIASLRLEHENTFVKQANRADAAWRESYAAKSESESLASLMSARIADPSCVEPDAPMRQTTVIHN